MKACFILASVYRRANGVDQCSCGDCREKQRKGNKKHVPYIGLDPYNLRVADVARM